MKDWLKKALIAFGCVVVVAAVGVGIGVGGSSCKDNNKGNQSSASSESSLEPDSETSEEINGVCSHDYGEPVIVAATCTEKGSKTYTCSLCDGEKVEVLDELGHNYAVGEQAEATCTAQGYNKYVCGNCGDSYTEITEDKRGHDTLTAEWTVVGESQTGDGCTWVQHEEAECAACGEKVTHDEIVVKHSYNVNITKAATCSEEGEKTYTCVCGDSYIEPFKNEGGHAWVAGEVDTDTGITTWSCLHNAAHTKTSFSAKDKVEATIPAAALQDAKEIELQNATLELPQEVKSQLGGEIKLSVDTLDDRAKDEATSGLTQEEQEKLASTPIFNFNMSQGDNAVTQFDKEITVTVPYKLEEGADPSDIAVWYINDEGKLTSIKATYSVVDGEGFATFTTDHFSYYTVVRLTAKERCALYGCEDDVTVIAPTCETDGYTLTKCIRCNKTTRSAFVKALGHTYDEKTVAPTCTAKGYTTYTCSREECGYSYASNWTETLAHEYVSTVVAPTCTSKGYTSYTCKGCGSTYLDSYVDAKGHAYVSGVCTACGKTDPSYVKEEEINFYFNAIEGLLNANTYYVEMKGFMVDVTAVSYYGENKEEERIEVREQLMTLENVQAEVAFGEDGYLVGKGVGIVKMEAKEADGETWVERVNAKVALYNKNIYMEAILEEVDEDGPSKETMIGFMSQDAMFEEMGISLSQVHDMTQSVGEMEDVVSILEGLKNTPDSPLNKIIENVVEYVYTKTETANGYHFELNFDRVEEVYKALTEQKINEVVDTVIGAGTFDKICEYLTATVDKEVSVVVEDLRKALDLCGVELDTVYNLINTMAGEEDFDIRTMVAQYSTMKVSELLDAMMEVEEPGSVDYKAMITEYATQIKEMTMADFFLMMFGSSEGGNKDDSAIMPASEEEDIMPVSEEEEDPIYATLMKVVAMLKKSSFSFATDKMGEVLYYTVNLVEFGDDSTVEDKVAGFDKEDGYDSAEIVKLTGKIVFKPNGTFAGSYDYLITKGEQMQSVADGYLEKVKEGAIDFEHYYNRLHVDVLDGDAWEYISIYEQYSEPEEVTYAGQKAIKMTVYGNVEMVMKPYPGISVEPNCLEWSRYSVQGGDYYTEFTVWMNEDGEYIGVELSEDAELSHTITVMEFYYNSVTGEYAVADYSDGMHKYVEVDYKPAEGCEGQGYRKYSCSLCGEVRTEYFNNGHNAESQIVLSEGSTSCEDGLDWLYVCVTCGKVLNKDEHFSTEHDRMDTSEVVATTPCGDIVIHFAVCLCGQEKEVYGFDMPCEFDWVDEENFEYTETVWNHYIATYRCAVTACGYTYTHEYYLKKEGCYTYEYNIFRYGVKEDSSEVDYQNTQKYVWDVHHLGWVNDKKDDGTGLYTIHNYCTVCGEVEAYHLARYDEQGRTTYYKNLKGDHEEEWEAEYYDGNDYGWHTYYYDFVDGDGYRRVYSGCDYEQYDLDGSYSSSGDMHWWRWWYRYSDSCTQYQFEGDYRYCVYCNEERYEGRYNPPKDHSYYYDEYLGLYVCETCGMKNETGADAIVIEDLTYTNDQKAYTVGYYNRNNEDYEVKVVVNYGEGNEQFLRDVICSDKVTHENSGIITMDMASLSKALERLQMQGYEVKTISLVLQYFDEKSGKYDEETGEWEGSWIDCVVTFE